LGARVMSHDESLHTLYSQYLAVGRGYTHTPLMHGPFLFHITALSYFLFGDSDFTARLPFAIFGIALVMMPLLFKRQLGREGALIACLLILISPSLLYHARYIRQEATVLVWTFLTALCIWRFFETRQNGWLLGMAAVLGFHGSDKSTSFLTVALFVTFLVPLALWQLYRARNNRRDMLNAVYFALVAGAMMLISTVAFELINGRISGLLGVQSIATEAATLAVNVQTIIYLAAMLALTGLTGYLFFTILRRLFGEWLPVAYDKAPAWSLIVVMVFTTSFMGTPALLLVLNPLWKAVGGVALIDVSLLGQDINIKTNPQVISTMLALGLAVAMVGVVIGLLWNWRLTLASIGIFLGITVPLFTTLFTNTGGIGTGFVGQLGYWMAQQEVMRGNQPLYYYLMVVPMYEYVSVLGLICAIVYLSIEIVVRGWFGKAGLQAKLREHLFPLMLVWWSIATWIIYTIAGEKMPWLTVHFALPQILLTGWLLQRAVNAISFRDGISPDNRARAWAVAGAGLLAVLFTVRLLSILGKYDPQAGSASLITSLANALIAVLVISIGVYLLRQLLSRGRLAAYGLVAFAFLSVLTVRTAVMASYLYYDYTREFLFYAHGAPGVKIITNQLDDLSRRLGTSNTLTVGYTQETSWPMSWYMRSYPGQRFLGAELPSDVDTLQVIIASQQDAKYAQWTEQLAENYTRFDYTMVWWPMEDYRDLNWERISYSLVNPRAREALWEIAFNRNFQPYAEIFNKTSLTADTWSPSHRITMFVRNDITQQVWDYRTGAVASGSTQQGPRLQQPSGIAFGPEGARWAVDHKANRVFKLDEANGVEITVGGAGNQPGKFNDPWGLAIDTNGYVYVADTFNHRIQKLDPTGGVLFAWGAPGATDAPGSGRETQFFGPRDILIDGQGRLLVADTGNKRIQVFDSEGNFVAQFGKAGAGDGEFNEPVGLALDREGNIYVADTWNKRVQVWSPDFTFVRSFPVPAWETMDVNTLQSVEHKPYMAINDNTLYVSSPRTGQVLGFSLAGQPKELPAITFGPEDWPTGIEVHEGRLFVTNARSAAIVEFPLDANAQ
jgi:predicted membrane-bound mannosyltransferase/DNA-binding beta-propeller fold protein YncE